MDIYPILALAFKARNLYLLPGLITAHLPSTDVVIQSEETIEEHTETNHGSREQPASVEP